VAGSDLLGFSGPAPTLRCGRSYGRGSLTLGSGPAGQPRVHVGLSESEQASELDARWQIAAGRVAVVNSLLREAESSCEGFGGEEFLHGVTFPN
jgi:hypothetical protein